MLRRLFKPLLYLPAATLVFYSIYATSTYFAHEEARRGWKGFLSQADAVQLDPMAFLPGVPPSRSLPEKHESLFSTLRKAGAAEATLSVEGVLEAAQLAESARLPVALEGGGWSREELAALQEELLNFHPLKSFSRSLLAERARFLARLEEAPREVLPLPSPEVRNATLRKLLLLNIKEETVLFQNKIHYGQFVDRHLATCFDVEGGRFNVAEVGKAIAELKTSLSHAPIAVESFASATELLRFFEEAAPEAARFQAWRDQAVVAVALFRYKEEHGVFPTSLAALAPDFLSAVPVDLLTGGPLLYTEAGSGFTLSTTSWKKAEGSADAPDWSWSEGAVRFP